MQLHEPLLFAGGLGSALMAGTFFAFSTFVMPALADLDARSGIRAMQAINVKVFHPLFMGAFLGTALVSLTFLGRLLFAAGAAADELAWMGPALYLIGVFGVTAAGNVPLNDRLAKVEPETPEGQELWAVYLRRWVVWNHVRTIASLLALIAFCGVH